MKIDRSEFILASQKFVIFVLIILFVWVSYAHSKEESFVKLAPYIVLFSQVPVFSTNKERYTSREITHHV